MRYVLMRVLRKYGPNSLNLKTLGAFLLCCGLSAQAQDAPSIQIAALGDSLTQGYGLLAEDGLTSQLNTWLTENDANATVLNAGVSGDTTAGGLARVEWTLTPDVDALIVALGGNDVLRGLPPQVARANIDGILKVAASRELPVLLVGTTVPPNFGSTYAEEFTSIYTELSEQYETLYFASLTQPLTKDRPIEDALSLYFQADGLHPNAEGVSLIVDAFGPSVLALAQRVKPE